MKGLLAGHIDFRIKLESPPKAEGRIDAGGQLAVTAITQTSPYLGQMTTGRQELGQEDDWPYLQRAGPAQGAEYVGTQSTRRSFTVVVTCECTGSHELDPHLTQNGQVKCGMSKLENTSYATGNEDDLHVLTWGST